MAALTEYCSGLEELATTPEYCKEYRIHNIYRNRYINEYNWFLL